MNTTGRKPPLFFSLFILALLAPAVASADFSDNDTLGGKAKEEYRQAVKFIQAGQYEQARRQLREALTIEDADADLYSLLGFATRKLGRPEASLEYYRQALRLKPDHRPSHEYIGEAYLQLNRPDKAREHLAFLDDDCWLPCDEYTELKEAIERYEARKGG